MAAAQTLFEARKLTKKFGGTTALASLDLDIMRGEVLGVVGENGAGKTTLINILSGIVQRDAGDMRLRGAAYCPYGQAAAVQAGISRTFQEQALIPHLSVHENLLLSQERRFTTFGQWLRTADMIEVANEAVREAGLAIDVRQSTSELSFSKRQLVEIVRACIVPRLLLRIESPIVLLDEPTASLEKADETIFFSLVERLRGESALVFISHRLGEVLSISDRIAVMKDGRLAGLVDPAGADETRLHALMVGRERASDHYREARQRDVSDAPVVFSLAGLAQPDLYGDIDLDIRAGEILGIGGLLASGKEALGKGASGVRPASSGTVAIDGEVEVGPSISKLIAKGLGYVPAERLAEGMIVSFPVSWNITLASGADIFSSRLGLWRTGAEEKAAANLINRLRIKAAGPTVPCSTLSGGNQQKVVLARWLCRDLKVLVLDNPTRGVDAGAREEIYAIIRDLADQGVAILLISDELLELIGLSNRIAILQHGRVTALLDAAVDAKPSEQQLIEFMLVRPETAGAKAGAPR